MKNPEIVTTLKKNNNNEPIGNNADVEISRQGF